MNPDKHNSARLPAGVKAQAVPWELPEVTGSHIVALERKREPESLTAALVNSKPAEVGLAMRPEVPEADVVTVSEAEEIREAAYQEGLLQGLVEGREKGHPEGLEKGLAEGRERGFQEAREQGQAEIDQAVANLAQMLQALEQPLAQQEAELEGLVSSLVIKLAKAVVDAELKTRPELIQNAVQQAIDQLPQGGGELKLTVSPADQAHLEVLPSHFSKPVSVVADAAVFPGSFQLQSSNSLVVSDVQAQFDDLAKQLFTSLSSPAGDGG